MFPAFASSYGLAGALLNSPKDESAVADMTALRCEMASHCFKGAAVPYAHYVQGNA